MHEQSGSYGSLESETSSLNSGEPDMNEKLTPVKWNILIRQLFARRNYIILILVPILLCPIPIVIGNQVFKVDKIQNFIHRIYIIVQRGISPKF